MLIKETRTYSLNLRGRLMSLSRPRIMAIMNVTPDSFFSGSRLQSDAAIYARLEEILKEGADILDIGGYSSRSGAEEISADEEYQRLKPALRAARQLCGDMPLSVDTFRAEVAQRCIDDFGVEIINDIGGGLLDPGIADVVARGKCAYVMMHMRGTPSNMQSLCDYPRGVVTEIIEALASKGAEMYSRGVSDVIADPGFGFAKTLSQNYEMLRHLSEFKILEMPILVGISRKSMIYKLIEASPESPETLAATEALNVLALINGAHILRVHDVKAAHDAIKIAEEYTGGRR